MFYISLPYFYQNYKFNNFFKNYINNNSNKNKLITKFNIEYAYGSFPWSLWNGGVNMNLGEALLSPSISAFITQTNVTLRLDASNINLSQNDYLDIHENSILKIMNGTNNIYEISIINLIDYLSQYNLNNRYIISNNAQIIHLFNEEIINLFASQDNISLINIGYQNNLNLDLIKDKTKLEISIGYCGKCSSEKCLLCSANEQQYIYNFSGQSQFINCPAKNKISNYYKELLPFYKQGIQHFKIITELTDINTFNINIIKSFIKPEFQGECINEYYNAMLQ